ncbi:AGD9 [Symbiodinium sp. CCMP2592]|nr:AGD9 [Symbiodinium sp. CCMP2592]
MEVRFRHQSPWRRRPVALEKALLRSSSRVPLEVPAGEKQDVLEGVRLVETPLKKLKELCDQLGLSRSGGKEKVLARLRQQRKVLEKRMTAEVAKKMYLEGAEMQTCLASQSFLRLSNRSCTASRIILWCEHCVVGRSKQSPHAQGQQDVE